MKKLRLHLIIALLIGITNANAVSYISKTLPIQNQKINGLRLAEVFNSSSLEANGIFDSVYYSVGQFWEFTGKDQACIPSTLEVILFNSNSLSIARNARAIYVANLKKLAKVKEYINEGAAINYYVSYKGGEYAYMTTVNPEDYSFMLTLCRMR